MCWRGALEVTTKYGAGPRRPAIDQRSIGQRAVRSWQGKRGSNPVLLWPVSPLQGAAAPRHISIPGTNARFVLKPQDAFRTPLSIHPPSTRSRDYPDAGSLPVSGDRGAARMLHDVRAMVAGFGM